MAHVITETHENILIIKLASGKANAIHADMLDEISDAVDKAAYEAVRGVVLASDRPRFFSAGFDLHEVVQYDRTRMFDFFGLFIDVYERLFRCPKPVIAALSGHTVAGGAVLALTADQRVMASGEFFFGLNEVKIGVALPAGVLRMAIAAVGLPVASRLALTGASLSTQQAFETGLVQEIAPPESVFERALIRAQTLAKDPPQAFAAVKKLLRREAGFADQQSDRDGLETFLDHWFSEESVQARQALAQSLRR